MNVHYISGLYILKQSIVLHEERSVVWNFLSDPHNLEKITPERMNFSILFRSDNGTGKVYKGQIICYRVSPFRFLRTSWITEITQVNEGTMFIDEQRFGPYKFWHHQHLLIDHDEGTVMEDIVCLKLPFGFLGRWFGGWIVKRKLRQIFEYRLNALKKLFRVQEF